MSGENRKCLNCNYSGKAFYLGMFLFVSVVFYSADVLSVVDYSIGIVQEFSNTDNGESVPQNFKLVSWDSISVKFNPPLKTR